MEVLCILDLPAAANQTIIIGNFDLEFIFSSSLYSLAVHQKSHYQIRTSLHIRWVLNQKKNCKIRYELKYKMFLSKAKTVHETNQCNAMSSNIYQYRSKQSWIWVKSEICFQLLHNSRLHGKVKTTVKTYVNMFIVSWVFWFISNNYLSF